MINDLSSLERAGQWELAAEGYERRFQYAAAEQQIADLVISLHDIARMRQQQGRFEEAEDLAGLSFEVANRRGLPGAAARATNTLAVLRHNQQDWNGARELYEVASNMATDLGDDTLLGWTNQNLGVIANILGNLRAARTMYLESIASTVRSGDRTTAMMAYNNLGIVCADLRDWIEAEVYFDRGIEIAEQLGSLPMLATLSLNRAEPLIELGDLCSATATLARAESLATSTGDQEILTGVSRFRGIIARLGGDYQKAEAYLTESLQTALDNNLELERAETLEELGMLRYAGARFEEASDILREARDRFTALGAARDAARVERVLAEWEAYDLPPHPDHGEAKSS